jgi:ATP-binding cassette subfamily B protein/subfamily B ATP-binding cassette protein MsbA
MPQSSRQRFLEYLADVRLRRRAGRNPTGKDTGTRPARQRSFGQLLWAFLGLVRGHWPSLSIALAALTLATLLKLAPPLTTKLTIDYVLAGKPLPDGWSEWLGIPQSKVQQLVILAACVLVISLVDTVLGLWGRWHATKATQSLQASLRRRVFEHAVRLPLHRVYQIKSGGVASILREDAGTIAELVFSLLYNPWRAIIQLIGSLAVLIWVDWRLMLGAIVLLPVVYLTHRTWISNIRPLHRDIRNLRQNIDSHATEAFGGMRVVRAFGRQKSEAGRFLRNSHMMARQQLFAWWWARAIDIAWEVLIPLASAALLIYGGAHVLEGRLSLGDLMMFLFYLAMLLEPLAVLANSAAGFQNSLSGLDRVLDLLAEPREMPRAIDSVTVEKESSAGRIRFRGVSFQYPLTQATVLHDIDLDVRPGETIALVGRSGAGKTTLCNLVARFYDPTSGSVELDGVDLRRIDVESYRRLLGIVEQDVFLFDGTIAENIAYASRHATHEQIVEAAKAAGADEFIARFEFGYETVIGERGVKLSGGQRQRLAIARAILADPRILILDEATSNLDSESERYIQRSLQTLLQGRTSFVIAHRLSTIATADRIVVLRDGEIVEIGTHEELLALGGTYQQMVELQTGIEERL